MSLLNRFKPQPIPRAAGVTYRATVVTLAARFMDELLSGLPDVLMPTIRATLGLSYAQVALLPLALNYVGAVIEPIAGLLMDVWQRKWLMAFGAAVVGVAVMVMGIAPTFAIMLLGFALYGVGSGPLAHSADVTLVETHPQAPDRIYARSTLIDTVGALLAPLLVTVTVLLGMGWRGLLVAAGASSVVYALIIWRTRFAAQKGELAEGESVWRAFGRNIRDVLGNRRALLWLAFLFVFQIFETPFVFKTIWLNEQVGMSQALIGVYVALEMGVGIVSLLFLDRWLQRTHHLRILAVACSGLLLLYPLWLGLPGIWSRFLLVLPLIFLQAVIWPISKAQSLASAPGKGGTVSAAQSLFGFVPFSVIFAFGAEQFDLTSTMLWTLVIALVLLLVLIALLARSERG